MGVAKYTRTEILWIITVSKVLYLPRQAFKSQHIFSMNNVSFIFPLSPLLYLKHHHTYLFDTLDDGFGGPWDRHCSLGGVGEHVTCNLDLSSCGLKVWKIFIKSEFKYVKQKKKKKVYYEQRKRIKNWYQSSKNSSELYTVGIMQDLKLKWEPCEP